MNIEVLFFGQIADRLGQRHTRLSVTDTELSLINLRDQVLGAAFESGRLSADRVQMSVNQMRVSGDCALKDGDEVAFFSAFSGG